MSEKPQKIGEVELLGEAFDLCRNGTFALMRIVGVDDYLNPIWRKVPVESLTHGQIQALINLVGETAVRLQGQRDLRRGEAE